MGERNSYASSLFCPLIKQDGSPFFSLVDYRNTLFMSRSPNKIIEFYNSFENSEQVIKWMVERPPGSAILREVEGDKEIVVIIPTSEFDSELARNCRENIFKGLQIIFVENGDKNDYYFNYAHNCNLGIRRALTYSPKWIVVSNDDMFKIDSVDYLRSKLLTLDNSNIDVIFTLPSKYHSIPTFFSEGNFLRKIFFLLRKYRRLQLAIERKYNVTLFSSPAYGYGRLFFKHSKIATSIADFGIFSSNFIVKKGKNLFDETYVHGGEDIDLSLYLACKANARVIDFRIGDMMGTSLGTGYGRKLRDIAGYIYLNYKVKKRTISICFDHTK